jgi:hypothetical protein
MNTEKDEVHRSSSWDPKAKRTTRKEQEGNGRLRATFGRDTPYMHVLKLLLQATQKKKGKHCSAAEEEGFPGRYKGIAIYPT